ncbi:MAG TPA: phytanoyl-CoA dioxygenase family protein [Streptosporangiaceae bacterium]
MRDSTREACDGDVLRSRMREEGYVLVRDVIDPDLLREAQSDVLDALRRAGWISDDGTLQPLVDGQEDPRYWTAFTGIQALESFHKIAFDTRLCGIMSALLGPDVYPWPGKPPYIMWPERLGGANTHPHQEGAWPADILSTWITLQEVPMHKGPLAVHPGTQKLECMPDYGYGHLDFGPDWATTGFGGGDVLIFHNLTVHGSLPNRSDSLRLSCSFKWQSAQYPAPEVASLPARHPRVPGWDVLTEGWTSTRWITPPGNAEFVPTVAAGRQKPAW